MADIARMSRKGVGRRGGAVRQLNYRRIKTLAGRGQTPAAIAAAVGGSPGYIRMLLASWRRSPTGQPKRSRPVAAARERSGPAPRKLDLQVVVISFVASIQVSTFTLITWSYNTMMMTGNLRSAAQALYLALADRDPESARKTRNFALIILGFLAGAVAGSRLTLWLGPHTIWVAAGVLAAALALFVIDERRTT